ncbi:extracellular catalytic domain type 1 short-chain-length polyhydroxyalkanoate depolymerase [Spirosoma flavus]
MTKANSAETDIRDTLLHDGMLRIYWVHLPAGYAQKTTRLPLVIALHGGGGSGQQFAIQSKWSDKADREGFIVVYPDGVQNPGVLRLRTWNAGACCGQVASTQRIDDVGFISKLIDKLSTTYQIDSKKVFATGHSNGGMLCYRLACELSEKITAIAANAGTMQLQKPCKPTRLMPVLHIHSQQDKNVPAAGGVGTRSINKQRNPSADSTLTVFAQLAGCTSLKPVAKSSDKYTFYEWTGCQNDVAIQYYLTSDGGHSWPGGNKSVRMLGDPPSEAFANNDIIWDFFKKYALH